jgi:GTP cyclohydrolase II
MSPDLPHPDSTPIRMPDQDTLRLRAVHRAAAELRRGTPVILLGEHPLIVLAADTAGSEGLADMHALAVGPPVLLLASVRAAALLRRPVNSPGQAALALRTDGLFDPATLRGLADPTAAQLLREPPDLVPSPPLAPQALALTKIGRLLPAALAAPLRPRTLRIIEARQLLSVEASAIDAHPDREAARLVRVAEARVPLEDAPDARIVAFRAPDAGIEHLAILVGQPEHATSPPLARLHSECFTGDLLGSLRCDCGPQLRAALRRMGEEGNGVLLYLAQEGRGIGLANKLRAYALQDRGLDTVDANRALGWNADERNFMVAATMLDQLGIGAVRLLTNNPDKIAALSACGITVSGREPLVIAPNGVNDHYLATKARRFGHLTE